MNHAGSSRKTNPNKANLKTENRSLPAISVAGQQAEYSPQSSVIRPQSSVLCPRAVLYSQYATPIKSTAPRRMNGKELEPARILTHYESDFGAAPKVEMHKGQQITVLNPDFAGRRWLGFEGEILDAPFYEICRTQLDVAVKGDDERLAEEIRGFHWMVAYGSYLREVGYAVKKAGLDWLRLV